QRKEKEIGREDESTFNIKVGNGALLDVQFAVQYLQLKYQVVESNTLLAIDKLEKKVPEKLPWAALKEALKFYFKLESVQDLRGVAEADRISAEVESNRQLALLLGERDPEVFLRHYRETARTVREIYLEVFAD
ncbi:MAG: hypothetical protein JSU96_03320, partial [Acidobacteriota bacterium]